MLWERGCIYKEKAKTEKYPAENYPLILQHLWLEGSCISKFLMKKYSQSQEAPNVTGWRQQSFGTRHHRNKKLRWLQNLTRKTQESIEAHLIQRWQRASRRLLNTSFWRLGKYHRGLVRDSLVPACFPTCLLLATARDRIQGEMSYWSFSGTAILSSAVQCNLA